MSFQSLNLDPKILSALENKGYTEPTPIQAQAIPHILEKKDILGIAQTGTGKTAAFSLPLLQNLSQSGKVVKSGGVRALILTPTRELASQIADNIEAYGKELGIRHAVIFGGVSEKPQIATLQRGVDILIATPGRLLDLCDQGQVRFMQLEIFILDEADRMLDMGFINDIKKIVTKLPQNRQTLFFSATMPETIADLANSILSNPIKIEVTPPSTTVERIEQKINFVERGNKLSLLKKILKQEDAKSVLVFSKTKHGANRIEEFLQKNSITVAAIHGNKSQSAREKALDSFREGKVQVLIATDIAARGIDIPAISHVINYDIPMDPESYVHRIGRTARAGRQGIAISFCDPSEIKLLQSVEKTIKYKIPVDETHPYHGVAAPATGGDYDGEKRSFGRKISAGSSSNRQSREGQRDRNSDRRDSGFDSRESRGGRNDRNRRDGSFNRRRENSDDNRGNRVQNDRFANSKKTSGLLSFIGLGTKKPSSRRAKAIDVSEIDFRSEFKKSVNQNDRSSGSRSEGGRSDFRNRGFSSGNSSSRNSSSEGNRSFNRGSSDRRADRSGSEGGNRRSNEKKKGLFGIVDWFKGGKEGGSEGRKKSGFGSRSSSQSRSSSSRSSNNSSRSGSFSRSSGGQRSGSSSNRFSRGSSSRGNQSRGGNFNK